MAIVLLFLAVLVPAAHATAGRSFASSGIVATFNVGGETFRAHIENPVTIEQVRALQRGESSATIPNGALRAGQEYNTGWSWHTDPWDIEMAEFTTEVCDGRPSDVEADQDYWLNTVGRYCPWSAVLVDVTDLGAVGGVAKLPASTILPSATDDALPAGVIAFLAGSAAVAGAMVAAAIWSRRKRMRRDKEVSSAR